MRSPRPVSPLDPTTHPSDEGEGDTLLSAEFPVPGLGGVAHERQRRRIEAALFGQDGEHEQAIAIHRYHLLDPIGEGGMGTIFAAIDGDSGAPVAIKVMQAVDHDARRFEREIAVLARLRHPRIVRYRDHGTTLDGRLYLVMERLRGEDLRSHLARHQPTVRECMTLGIDVAEGLQAAHELGYIHRDIKPSNLFLIDGAMEGSTILDFGIARGGASMPSITHTGTALGTLGYMAPEQALGDPHLDHRVDIFSLGCVLYEALAGQPPFPGDSAAAILTKILLEEPRPLRSVRPDVPEDLAAVVHAALAKRPEERPTSAAAMIAALRVCAAETSPAFTRSTRTAVISYREQEAHCILLLAGDRRPDDPLAVATRAVAAAFGATIILLIDGSEVLVLELDGSIGEVITQAARCALSIRSLRPGARLALAVGRGERSADSFTGPVIEQALLLVEHAEAGTIVVEASAARALGPTFEVEASGAHVRLVEEREELSIDLLLGKPSPFVGRSRELALLGGLFQQVLEEGRSASVVITAPSGLGKSRLWREFARGLVTAGHAPRILVISCAATLAGSPLGALGVALRRIAGIVSGDAPVAAREKFVARFGAGAKQARLLAELCGVDLGTEVDETTALVRRNPTVMADAQRLAWLDWLQTEADRGPLLLVVEDLQWCDERTAGFVSSAVRDLAERDLLLIATALPEAAACVPAGWSVASTEVLPLAPINARASEMLVRQVLGPMDPDVLESVIARAGGNPFFLEELVRALGTSPAEALPDSVLSVVQARLRRLGHEERRLLRAASVFAGSFDVGAVAWLLGSPTDVIAGQVQGLIDAEILALERDAVGAVFCFRHELVRDAAYAMLTELDRPSAHRAAAEWLASAGGYEPARIAAHYARGDALTAAGEWYVRAARWALACTDVVAAAEHAAQAVACGVDGHSLAEIRVVQADVAIWGGDAVAGDRHARQALCLVPSGSELWFTALRRILHCAFSAMRMDEVRVLTGLLQPFRGTTAGEYVLSVAEAAFALAVAGAIDEARALLEEIAGLSEVNTASPLIRASIHRVRAAIATHDHQLWVGLKELERAIALFEEADDMRSAGRLRATLAWLLVSIGAADRADEILHDGLRLMQRIGAEHSMFYLNGVLSWSLMRQGRLAEAEAQARVTGLLEQARARGELRLLGYVLLIRVSLDADDEEAIVRAREIVESIRPFTSTYLLGSAVLALKLLRSGAIDEAMALARSGLETLRCSSSALDDVFFVWSSFTRILDHGGATEEADLATASALTRLARLHAQIEEPALQRSLLAYEPAARLLIRARTRGIFGAEQQVAVP